MIEGWRDHSAPQDEDALDWVAQESALEVSEEDRRGAWAPAVTALVAFPMLCWGVAAGWLLVDRVRLGTDPATLLLLVGAAAVPLVLGVQLLLAIRQSPAMSRRRVEASRAYAASVADRLDTAAARFAARVRHDGDEVEARAERWHALSDNLADRSAALSAQLDSGLAAMDERLGRIDAVAAGARRDLAAVLVGLPRAEAKTRELAGSLRDAGLTAHEGANALDAQLGLLRHRAGEADEVASAAASRLGAQLARMEDVGQAAGERLIATTAEANHALDGLVARADEAIGRAADQMTRRGEATTAAVERAERALDEANERAAAQMAARLDLLDERLRAVAERIAAGDAQVEERVAALDQRVVALGDTLAELRERSVRDLERFDGGLRRLDEHAEGLTARIGTGDEAMSFALGRAESLLGALDAAARELDETLPASFGRFERSAGEGFERLARSMPELERYHALTEAAAARIKQADAGVTGGGDRLEAALALFDERLAHALGRVDELARRVTAMDGEVAALETERAPRLAAALEDARATAESLGELAMRAVDEAVSPARDRMVDAVTGPVADAIDRTARERMETAALVAADAVASVERAAESLRDELERIEATGRQIAERGDSVLALARDEGEAGFSRRVALLVEALNSTAIDVAKVLSNDVSDTVWAAYLKGDRGVFTRRAVRLLDAGEAREILRAYDDDGEFRGQVNRYIHDFEALLRTVLADANGSPMAVTLLSSDTGKLYVALAQAIERLRD